MKGFLAILVTSLGFCLAIYVGLFVMFIGGIIQLIQSVTPVVVASGIAFGLVRIIFASFVGWIIAWIAILLGKTIVD